MWEKLAFPPKMWEIKLIIMSVLDMKKKEVVGAGDVGPSDIGHWSLYNEGCGQPVCFIKATKHKSFGSERRASISQTQRTVVAGFCEEREDDGKARRSLHVRYGFAPRGLCQHCTKWSSLSLTIFSLCSFWLQHCLQAIFVAASSE